MVVIAINSGSCEFTIFCAPLRFIELKHRRMILILRDLKAQPIPHPATAFHYPKWLHACSAWPWTLPGLAQPQLLCATPQHFHHRKNYLKGLL